MSEEIFKKIRDRLTLDNIRFTITDLHGLYVAATELAEKHQGDKREYAMNIILDVLGRLKESELIKLQEIDTILEDVRKYGPVTIDLIVTATKGRIAVNKIKSKCCF